MNELTLRLKSGATLVVPASLDSITTYVLLEQEQWFEKEVGFLLHWLRPGMTAVDIGANLGVYSVPIARRIGPHGHVFAYEPASAPRGMLERSREINRADNLHIVAAAVSDAPREGQLVLGASSELNSLTGSGPGEAVRVTCLDEEDRTRGWSSVDVVKIDAEGEEERIIAGGKSFFDRHSPLVLFEIKVEASFNEALRLAFPRIGYDVYRQLPGAPILVRDEPDQNLDPFELNLLAIKPDRAAALAAEGALVDAVADWRPDADARSRATEVLRAQPFAPAFAPMFGADADIDADYRDGLAAYAAWRSVDLSLAVRCGALQFACKTLLDVCEGGPTLARFSTLARVASEAGQRALCIAALKGFGEAVMRGDMSVSEPFWPASARFDALPPEAKRAEWLLVSAFEQLERAGGFSSVFADSQLDLGWLCAQPFVSTEMERRWVLQRALAGERVEVPARLCVAAEDHLNADIWRAGLVPNTIVGRAAQAG
jgi:FkbM family methyltransferase